MVSIHRPLGYGPSTLPLRHAASLSSLAPIHALLTESRGRHKSWILSGIDTQSLWRNRLARSAVNRKVGGSSPPGGANFFTPSNMMVTKKFDPGRTRTCNPLIRSQMPYPLGHRAGLYRSTAITLKCHIAVIAQLGER